MSKPLVAIVGRPNVGKSALLNRLIQSREAIVEGTPGVTRDRIYRHTNWGGRDFTLIDTGGILIDDPDNMKQLIRVQVEIAIDEADLILFVVDAREGLNVLDDDVAIFLRNSQKKAILVANKADNQQVEAESVEFYTLGFGEPLAVSAIHGHGTGDLLDIIVENLPPASPEEEISEDPIRITIMGRPNVGKSSLLNAILGTERAIVTDIPGTTRDIVDSDFEWSGNRYTIIDTAGIRRKAKVTEDIEFYSNKRAEKALDRCDLGILVLDATEPAVMQDMRIGGMLIEAGKGIIIVVNKWDLATPDFKGFESQKRQLEYRELLASKMDFISYAPVIFTCAIKNKGIDKIMPAVAKAYEECTRRIETSVINEIFKDAFYMRPPPSFKGNNLKLFYAHQAGVKPPRFVLKVNSPKLVHFSYQRYLENQLRRALGFEGSPIKLIFKK